MVSLGCGPASLDVMVREAVASEIDPGRVRRGEHVGYAELVSEAFEYQYQKSQKMNACTL